MSRIRSDEVREIAALARLALGDQEIARMTQDLDAILGYVEALRELDTSATAPMTHAVPFDCPLRPDVVEPGLSVDEALGNAPRRQGSYFQVPRILPGPAPGGAPPVSPVAAPGSSTIAARGAKEGG
ncbi:MAG: Asp-tRNA(Asn)/Glu-tRNA(Gln) amidotransferase subunit GatC [Pseudomonadota bacterium]